MPAAEENTTPESVIKKKRVQLKHLLLDCDFFDKPKIVALQYRFTPLGVGALIHILSAMSKGTNGEIPVDCALAILDRHGVPEKDKFIPYCLGLGILHAGSSELFISNCRVVEDQEAMAKNQDKWRNKKRQQRDKEGTPPESLNIEDLKNEDLKDPKRGVQGGGDCTGAKIPAALNTPEVAQAVGRWRAHLLKNHNRVFDAIAEESLYASYATRRDELIKNIEWSVQSGWKTIREAPKPDERTRAGPVAPGARNFNATIEAMKNIFAECEHETE